jgi:hypothetical protein
VDLAAIGLIAAVATKLPAVGGDLDRAIESVWMMASGEDQVRLLWDLERLTDYGYLDRTPASSRGSGPWLYSYAIAPVGTK